MTRVEIDTHRQVFAGESQRVTKLLLARLSASVAELLLDLHPPYAKPSLVSSSGPPGACATPSRETNSSTLTFLMA